MAKSGRNYLAAEDIAHGQFVWYDPDTGEVAATMTRPIEPSTLTGYLPSYHMIRNKPFVEQAEAAALVEPFEDCSPEADPREGRRANP